MQTENETEISSDTPEDIPPVFEEIDEDPPQETGTAPKPRRAPRRAVASAAPAAPSVEPPKLRPYTDDDADYETWASKFEWDKPGFYMRLDRIAPSYHEGKSAAGFLEKSIGRPFKLEEIRDRWAGGEYKATVIGPRANPARGRESIMVIGHKRFSLPGDPIIDGMPSSREYTVQGHSSPRGQTQDPGRQRASFIPPAERESVRALDIVDEQFKYLQKQVGSRGTGEMATLNLMQENMSQTVDRIREAETSRAETAVRAAESRANDARVREEATRKEKERIEAELRQREKQMIDERMRLEGTLAEKLSKVQGDSSQLLTLLLPQLSKDANDQVKYVTQLYETRLAAESQAHQNTIAQVHDTHRQQLDAQRMMYEGRLEAARQDGKNNSALLERQLETLRGERDRLQQSLEDTRRETQRVREDLMQTVMAAKAPKSPTEQMGEMATLVESFQTIKNVVGGGSGEETPSPEDNSVMGLATKFLGVLPELIAQRQAAAANAGQPPGDAPQFSQAQVQELLARQAATIQQQLRAGQQQPRLGPASGQPKAAKRPPNPEYTAQPVENDDAMRISTRLPKLTLETIRPALDFLNAVLASTDHPAAAEVATGAAATQDHAVLRALAYRDPDKLIDELVRKGVITADMPLHTAENQAYLKDLLLALRTRITPP